MAVLLSLDRSQRGCELAGPWTRRTAYIDALHSTDVWIRAQGHSWFEAERIGNTTSSTESMDSRLSQESSWSSRAIPASRTPRITKTPHKQCSSDPPAEMNGMEVDTY